LASGDQNNAQVKQNNARSITKIEKSNYNSVAQNAVSRSKSNGRQNVNSYGKLQTSKQLYDNSLTTREAATISQNEQSMNRREAAKNQSGRVVHQLVNIYQNQNPAQNTGPSKNSNKYNN